MTHNHVNTSQAISELKITGLKNQPLNFQTAEKESARNTHSPYLIFNFQLYFSLYIYTLYDYYPIQIMCAVCWD